jgi:hypothetical protein
MVNAKPETVLIPKDTRAHSPNLHLEEEENKIHVKYYAQT